MTHLWGKQPAVLFAALALCLVAVSCPSPVPETTVPDCVGLTFAAAQTAIGTAGFLLGNVRHEYSGIFDAGEVISQDPAAGATMPVLSSVSLVVSKGPEKVTFLDPALDLIIRQKIGKPTGDIYSNELTGLVILDQTDRGIIDLSGIEHCVNLRGLYLRMNEISDLTPLARLSKLETLQLWSNQIVDLTPLSGLVNLKSLDLRSNLIENISPLASLVSLESLRLDSNLIADIGPLASLTTLTNLSASYNEISELSPLSQLVNLQYLSLNYNEIEDLGPLSGLWGLLSLALNANAIGDLAPLVSLISLEWLGLSNNQISDLEPLSGLTNLRTLLLGENLIERITPLVDNEGLGTGPEAFIFLSDNPLDQKSLCEDIPALELRNVTVYYHGKCES